MDVLQEKIRKMKNPTMLGLDPMPALIPPQVLQRAFAAHGETPQGLAAAYLEFGRAILEALRETVPAVKVQPVCFEVLGGAGTAAVQELCAYAKELGYYVVLDAMRGDAPHIAELYAQALFGGMKIGETAYRACECDAVTLNGYRGSDAVRPYLPYCRDGGKDVFVLVKSVNRSGREVQDLMAGDRLVHTAMADLAMRWSEELYGRCGYSAVGALLGADGRVLSAMRAKYDRLFFLVTGYGVQGGTAKPVANAFDRFGHGAIVSASRSILGAWQKAGSDGSDWAEQARQAALKMRDDISKYVTVM